MKIDLTSIIGIIASIFTAASLLPQLIKLIKEKDPGAVSMGMMVTLLIGLVCWIVYGILRKDWIILLSNAFSLCVNLVIITLSINYKNKQKL